MLADLTVTCSACESPLTDGDRHLTMRTPAGVRHAYECDCGSLTITVSKR